MGRFCARQGPLNHLQTAILRLLGPMAWGTWAQRPIRGSLWVVKYPYCHQMTTQTHPRGDKRVSEKNEF